MAVGKFLAGVFGLTWNPETQKYLILQRSGDRDHAPGVWECISGRVDQGEGFAEALQREGREELGVDLHFEFIVGTVHFYRGPRTPEYELVGLVCFCTLDHPEKIQISAEHAQYRWVSVPEVVQMLPEEGRKVRFIHDVIHRAEDIRKQLTPELQKILSQSGLEIKLS